MDANLWFPHGFHMGSPGAPDIPPGRETLRNVPDCFAGPKKIKSAPDILTGRETVGNVPDCREGRWALRDAPDYLTGREPLRNAPDFVVNSTNHAGAHATFSRGERKSVTLQTVSPAARLLK